MKSKELRNIKKTTSKRRVLFINLRKTSAGVNTPHMGLALLAAILKKRGHEVLIVDYQLVHNAPGIEHFIEEFNPDIIGMSIYTANVLEADSMIERINKKFPKIPIIVGGPHATLYSENLKMKNQDKIDYVVAGEAELIIIEIIEKAKKEKKYKIAISKEVLDPNDAPFPDYKVFYGWQHIRAYPIMTSRGCPFRCSFCPVASLSQRKWRPRTPEQCIEEIEKAKKELNPNLHILVQDDHPLVDKDRFYQFLKLYIDHKINMRMDILNTRADSIDEKLIILLKKAGCSSIGIGVEHVHPEVFKLINKGESLEQIEHAANLLKKHKMLGSFSFIIGLPGDNLERIKENIKFVRRFRPDSVYWNMLIPYEKTQVREWFKEHGRLYNEIGHTSLVDTDFMCDEPCVETSDFTKGERIKAHFIYLFGTIDDRLKIRKIFRILKIAKKYNLYTEFFYWLPRGIIKSFKRKIELLQKAHAYSHREGINGLIKRSIFLLKGK